jgi:hypothetical protein
MAAMKYWTSQWKKRFTAYAVVVVLVLGGTIAVAHAVTTTRNAPITKFVGVDEIVEQCTNSTTFTQMPNMARNFTLGGSVNDEVVAMFTGSLSLGDDGGAFDTGFIRLTIDGFQQTPGVVPAMGVNDRGAHGFNFQTSALTPGMHTARIQWRTDLGSTFCVDARSLIILSK